MTISPLATPTFLTELTTAEIPNIFRRFDEVIGARRWQQRVKQIKGSIKANRLLGDLLHRENAVPFGLVQCGDLMARFNGRMPYGTLSGQPDLYGAMAFAGQALSMMDLADAVQRKRLIKRVEDALTNPDAMRGLRLELSAATHFARRGHVIEWPEMSGAGTFDLLVHGLGTSGLEVECKSISEDKGRAVHRRDALEMHGLLKDELTSLAQNLVVGLAVVVTVPQRLPKAFVERRALALAIRSQINIGHGARLEGGTDIRIEQFDAAIFRDVDENTLQTVFRSRIEQVTRTKNREAVAVGRKGGGLIIVVLQGAGDDELMAATFKTLSDAAKRQVSGTRPALLVAGFDGLDDEELLSIAQQDNDPQQPATSLVRPVSDFLAADHRPHVTGVCLFSRMALRGEYGSVGSGGTAYYFPKRRSPFWTDDLSGLFNKRAQP